VELFKRTRSDGGEDCSLPAQPFYHNDSRNDYDVLAGQLVHAYVTYTVQTSKVADIQFMLLLLLDAQVVSVELIYHLNHDEYLDGILDQQKG
jgi:hypothetical protein